MNELLQELENHVKSVSASPTFTHHKWFFNWHLKIVEKITMELCQIYKEADLDLLRGLVWMHDYAKITDFAHRDVPEVIAKGADVLRDIGFNENYISKLMEYLYLIESKMTVDLNQAPLEVKIVSSADGAAHMIGPFFLVYLHENPEKPLEELLESNIRKLAKDWDRKIVLPEAKEAFRARYEVLRELNGILPAKLL